jgi:hypothetical protein
MKNSIHYILAKNNLTVPVSDLFGKKGLAVLFVTSLPAYYRQQVLIHL